MSFSTHQSHYNTKLNRCLLLMSMFYHYPPPDPFRTEEVILVDENERRVHGSYSEKKLDAAVLADLRTGKKTSGENVICELTPSILQKIACKNRA